MQTTLTILQAIGIAGGCLFALKVALVASEDIATWWRVRRAARNAVYTRIR